MEFFILHLVLLALMVMCGTMMGENEGDFDKLSSRDLLKCKGKKLILVVYARV